MEPRRPSKSVQQFELEDKRQQVQDIEEMIADFRRLADDLDQQIEAEQKACGISDVNHFAYPTFARAAMTRRDNLRSSIRDLEKRLEAARRELRDLSEQVKTNEIAQGMELQRFSRTAAGRRRPARFLSLFTENR
jgi:flagellar export protein FliJ